MLYTLKIILNLSPFENSGEKYLAVIDKIHQRFAKTPCIENKADVCSGDINA